MPCSALRRGHVLVAEQVRSSEEVLLSSVVISEGSREATGRDCESRVAPSLPGESPPRPSGEPASRPGDRGHQACPRPRFPRTSERSRVPVIGQQEKAARDGCRDACSFSGPQVLADFIRLGLFLLRQFEDLQPRPVASRDQPAPDTQLQLVPDRGRSREVPPDRPRRFAGSGQSCSEPSCLRGSACRALELFRRVCVQQRFRPARPRSSGLLGGGESRAAESLRRARNGSDGEAPPPSRD